MNMYSVVDSTCNKMMNMYSVVDSTCNKMWILLESKLIKKNVWLPKNILDFFYKIHRH